MAYIPLSPDVVAQAYQRTYSYTHRTPLITSDQLNRWLGHEIMFKVEGFQKIGAFKLRGALNVMLKLKEEDQLPREVVAFSSGNHAQAVAYAARLFQIPATICMMASASSIKKQATQSYGAKIISTKTREEAQIQAAMLQKNGAYLIHPFDNDHLIAGQGTACYEALQEYPHPDAIFAPCGGGGLLSGTYLAAQLLAPGTHVYAGEPASANDASRSYKAGRIIGYDTTPPTIADGVATPEVSQRTFEYLKQLNGFYEVSEADIIYWTQWLTHLLKTTTEPTSAVAMGAAHQWLAGQKTKKRVLIILSGGNISPETQRLIWQSSMLETLPSNRIYARSNV